MTATLIDGRAVAERLRERVAARTAELARHGLVPGLAVVLVGEDPASQVYVGSKTKQAAAAGLKHFDHRLPTTTSTGELIALVERLNAQSDVHGILVHRGVLDALEAVAQTRRELRTARRGLQDALRVNTENKFQLAVFSAGSEIVIRGFVFPVGEPYSFIDSWGYPRMSGTEYEHGHQGVDIMAPFDTPLYAVERGIITRLGTDVLGGTKLWLKGQSGTYYYYAHLKSYADGIAEGTLVNAGDIVGYNGDSGNAQGGEPHLHFQVHPNGGEAVNPYGLLRVVADLSRG